MNATIKSTYFQKIFLIFIIFSTTLSAQFLPTNYDEPYRGQFHFSQQSGWMNDINGLWYFNGTYYLCYQTTPKSPIFEFAHTSWGMATSPDMMHWTQKPVIMEPNDIEGTPMSGSAVIDTGNTSGFQTGANPVFVAMYTSSKTGQCLMYSNDLGDSWERYSGNPVISDGGTNPRDPHVLWYAPTKKWVMVLYHENNGGNTQFYTSPDLINWTLTSTVTGFGHECPDFFELPVNGNPDTLKWVLWAGDGGYLTGDFDGSIFTQDPGGWKLLDNNNSTFFYAAQTFNTASLPSNRVIQMAWQGNPGLMGSTTIIPEYGAHTRWNQNATFPTQLSLNTKSGSIRLCANPIPEISTIWASTQKWEKQTLTSTSDPLSLIKSKCFDVTAEFDLSEATATQIKFQIANKTITYNITNKTLNGKTFNPIDNKIKIRILSDRSQYELFGNDGLFCWSERFAFDPNSKNLSLTVNGNITLDTLVFHHVSRTWADSETSDYTKYEAESGTVSGGAVKANYASASGGYQVGVLDNIGANFQISIYAPSAGTKTITLVYSNGMSDIRYKSLYVNDVKIRQLSFPQTGGWNQYSIINTEITLNEGNNILKIQRDADDNTATDIDYILMPWKTEIDTTNLTLPSNPNIQYMGRIDFSNPDKPLFAYPNTTIKAKFEGTSLNMMLNHFNGSDFTDNYFVSVIDDKDSVKFQVTSGQIKYPIVKNLTEGTHTVEIIKVTEAYCGECQFLGFQLDSAKNLLSPDPLPDLKLEFFGNSITCGYGIEGGEQPESDNSCKAYPAVAARELNAQFHTISYSGIGVVKGYPSFLMRQMYNRTIALTDYIPFPSNNTWDFTKYIPDFVVVALGTNDYNLGFGSGSISTTTFKNGYKSLITKIRTSYPNAFIICTNSPMISDVKLGDNINEVVSNLNTAGDNKVYYFAFTHMQGGGFNGHPGVADGQTNGKELVVYIKSLLATSSIKKVNVNTNGLTLFPNPTKDSFSVKMNNDDIVAEKINIYSLQGQQVKSFDNTQLIDVENLKKGMYLVNVTYKGKIYTQSVVLN
ncbi:MAG: GDSL-type esterase/lipase family protein [Salinivirgaceae bacterium]|jgi:fructan beta-fructosidase|nr:GDSL-type esterase/lipase family protein [Salinivirgaceae bacterium]